MSMPEGEGASWWCGNGDRLLYPHIYARKLSGYNIVQDSAYLHNEVSPIISKLQMCFPQYKNMHHPDSKTSAQTGTGCR